MLQTLFNKALPKISVLLVIFSFISSADAFDLTGGFKGMPNGGITASAKQDNGKILVTGAFTTIGGQSRTRIARLMNDGSVDPDFKVPGTGVNDLIFDLAIQPDGRIVIVGSFTSVAGSSRSYIARLETDGSLDTSFQTPPSLSANTTIDHVRLQSDGKIIIVGDFSSFANQPRRRIARLNQNGTLDSSFVVGTGFNDLVSNVAVAADDRIAVSGFFTSYNGFPSFRLIMLNPDGTRDTTFQVGSSTGTSGGLANALRFLPNGQLMIAGFFNLYQNQNAHRIARINRDGSRDTLFQSFDQNTVSGINTLTLADDGGIIVAGGFSNIGNPTRSFIAKLNPEGTLDTRFDIGTPFVGNPAVLTVQEQDDGHILVGGTFTGAGPVTDSLTRFTASGLYDSGELVSANARLSSIAEQPDGKVVIGGRFTQINGQARTKLARLNQDGSLDSSFVPLNLGTNSAHDVVALGVQPDGKILIGGQFTFGSHNGLMRLMPDGSQDASFLASGTPSATASDEVRAISVQPDGKILVGGGFTTLNGATVNRLTRLNPDGMIDTAFAITNFNARVDVVNLQPDGKILVGGQFTTLNGTAANRIVRLNPNGTRDTSFSGSANSNITSITTLPNGKIIISGALTSYDGSATRYITRLNQDGSRDSSFVGFSSNNGNIVSSSVYANGNILSGGTFTSVGGMLSNRLGRLQASGEYDTEFNVGIGANNTVVPTLIRHDGIALVGGDFSAINSLVRERFARIGHPDDPVDMNLLPDFPKGELVFQRRGAAPLLNWVTLETSEDGSSWSAPIRGARSIGDWKFSDIDYEANTVIYLRIRGTYGGSRLTNGSLFEKAFQLYPDKSKSSCDFFNISTADGNAAVVCL